MICCKNAYKSWNYDSRVINFPNDKNKIQNNFDVKGVLPTFTLEQKEYVYQSLSGTSKDALGLTDILQRAVTKMGDPSVKTPQRMSAYVVEIRAAVERIMSEG